jgi:polysaccharide export outer membrane protein
VSGFSEDYQVGAGDALDIQVVGHDELRESARVSNLGEINVSLLGLVKVIDMTTFEIEDMIAERLRSEGLVTQPEVLVSVTEFRARPVHILGAINTPGEYVMSNKMTALDAVLLAGGLRFNAGDEALVHRRLSADAVWSPAAMEAQPGQELPGVEVIRVDLKPMKEGQSLPPSPVLRRGDVVVVPEEVLLAFFVVGEVMEPRNFFYRPDQKISVSEAISMAAGPSMTAKLSQGMLVRYDEQGNRIEKRVDYDAILKGRQPDFQIQPNDIIFIPGSKVKTVTQGMIRVTGSAIMSAGFRIGRTYQLPDAPARPAPPPY